MATNILRGTNNSYITDTSIQSGMIENVLSAAGRREYSDAKIGCDIYKTVSPFKDFLRGQIELNVGAHYYVWGPYGNTYTKASIEIPLAQCEVLGLTAAANRRACISMGIHSLGKRITQCDVGLVRDRDTGSWRAFCWCGGKKDSDVVGSESYGVENTYSKSTTGSGLKFATSDTVRIEYSVGRDTQDWLKVKFFKNQGETAVAVLSLRTEIGQMFEAGSANSAPNVTFMRFMSLIPASNQPEDDNADGSAMSATIHSCTLYKGTTPLHWNKSLIWNAWAMQKSDKDSENNMPTLYISDIRSPMVADDADYCHIHHHFQAH